MMIKLWHPLLLLLLLLLVACSGPEKKVYPKLDPIAAKVQVTPLWVARVGAKHRRQHRQLSVAVNDDRVYAASARGELMAIKQNGGNVLWSRPLGVEITAGPTVDGERLYLATGDAQLMALKTESGDELWRAPISSELLSAPTVAADRLFVHTIDGKLSCYNKANGDKIWTNSQEVPALTLRGTSSPIVVGDRVIGGFANGKLIAFETETGKKLWESVIAVPSGRTDLQRMVDIDGFMQVDDGNVYVVTYQGRIAAVSANDGSSIWVREMSSYTGVTMDQQQLYLTDAQGNVWSVDRRSGATLWRQDALKDRDVTAPVIHGDTVVVADGGGMLHWLSKEDGAFVARKDLAKVYDWAFYDWGDENRNEYDFGVTSTLEVANGRLYVRNNMGALSVFELPSSNN
ncbi:MAG: outer membrane protein assembly factor BamB [Gammaproteobacteria bacterium]|jgi:outer membrane protein assembly factor BamB